jgi:hypothetical protein
VALQAYLLIKCHVLLACALPQQLVQPVLGISFQEVLVNLSCLIMQCLWSRQELQETLPDLSHQLLWCYRSSAAKAVIRSWGDFSSTWDTWCCAGSRNTLCGMSPALQMAHWQLPRQA